VVVDAFSKNHDEEGSLFSLSFMVPNWLQEIHQEWSANAKVMHMIY
jgi:hypothetical protein